jgi:hypothetical protein
MATAITDKTICLPCPFCGALDRDDHETGLVLHLASGQLYCRSCDETVSPADLQRMADEVTRLRRLLDAIG